MSSITSPALNVSTAPASASSKLPSSSSKQKTSDKLPSSVSSLLSPSVDDTAPVSSSSTLSSFSNTLPSSVSSIISSSTTADARSSMVSSAFSSTASSKPLPLSSRQRSDSPENSSSEDEDLVDPIKDSGVSINPKAKRYITAEQVALAKQARSFAPVRGPKTYSIDSIFLTLSIPKEDWDLYKYAVKRFYELGNLKEDEMETRIVQIQGECRMEKGKIPVSLYQMIIRINSTSASTRQNIFKTLGIEKPEKKRD